MRVFRVFVVSAVLVLAAARAEAMPLLQLDIIGGHYDPVSQTVISDGPDFTLVALLTPRAGRSALPYLNDTYYISAAVSPSPGPIAPGSLGSFTWNDANYRVTEDMTYGTPPLEDLSAHFDPGDLQEHSVFPTFFNEFSFQFSPANRTVSYDSSAYPGGLTPTTATTNISYFATFNVTTAMLGSNVLHFDLYSSYVLKCKQGPCELDEDIASWAPFRNDAQSSNSVAEPQSLLAMSVGLLFAARALRRRKA